MLFKRMSETAEAGEQELQILNPPVVICNCPNCQRIPTPPPRDYTREECKQCCCVTSAAIVCIVLLFLLGQAVAKLLYMYTDCDQCRSIFN